MSAASAMRSMSSAGMGRLVASPAVPGLPGRAVDGRARVFAAEGPAECVFAPSAADDEQPHDFWACRNALPARSAAFFAASATCDATSLRASRRSGARPPRGRPAADGRASRRRGGRTRRGRCARSRPTPPSACSSPARTVLIGWVSAERGEHLVDDVEPLVGRRVLVRLGDERVDVELAHELIAAPAAGHLHERAAAWRGCPGCRAARRGRWRARTSGTTRGTRAGPAAARSRRAPEARRG